MAFAYIQSASNTGSVTTLAATITASGVNNLLVVNLRFNLAGGVSSVTVTDNASTPNTYAQAIALTASNTSLQVYQFYAVQVTGGTTSVTASWTGTASARIIVDEFSGNAASNATVFDTASSGTGLAGTSGSVTPLVPAATGELISAGLGTFGVSGVITQGTGYTLGTTTNASGSEYNLSSSASETAPISWVSSNDWGIVAGAYKVASAAVSSSVNFVKAPTIMVMR